MNCDKFRTSKRHSVFLTNRMFFRIVDIFSFSFLNIFLISLGIYIYFFLEEIQKSFDNVESWIFILLFNERKKK